MPLDGWKALRPAWTCAPATRSSYDRDAPGQARDVAAAAFDRRDTTMTEPQPPATAFSESVDEFLEAVQIDPDEHLRGLQPYAHDLAEREPAKDAPLSERLGWTLEEQFATAMAAVAVAVKADRVTFGEAESVLQDVARSLDRVGPALARKDMEDVTSSLREAERTLYRLGTTTLP